MADPAVPGTQPDFAAVRAEFDLPAQFPPEVLAAAAAAADAAGRDLAGRVDATDIELVTIDPPGAKDLDQAVGIRKQGKGFRVHYAIADLGAVVRPGGAVDEEVRRRGQTVYLPDGSVPLHPPVLSEDAASLLPDGPRPAVLWEIDLDAAGEVVSAQPRRALVRSRAQLDYEGVQALVDRDTVPAALEAFAEVGRLRRLRAVERGAIELELPEQEVRPDGAGGWRVAIRHRPAVEDWNAEISLLTGMCAARIMLDAGIGLLRTLPEPSPGAVAELRRTADALDLDWPTGATVAVFLSGLPAGTTDPTAAPEALALRRSATRLLRGAGYLAVTGDAPPDPGHAGIGAPYAHVTAPLRRLVDRFGIEVCLAVTAGDEVPDWLRAALPALPELMARSDATAAKVDRACVDRTEAARLAGHVGESFEAIVLRAGDDREDRDGEVFLPAQAVMARCTGPLRPGERTTVRLVTADPTTGRVEFTLPG